MRLKTLMDHEIGSPYLLVFSEAHSDYEDWITHLGGPDDNARLLMKMLRGSGTLIDVGANIGTISVPVAKRGTRVFAIEMVPDHCLRLWSAASQNRLTNLHIVQVAAGDYDGMITFQGTDASANVYAEKNGTPSVCLRIDTLLDTVSIVEPLVMKIDVEGHEAAVLRGSLQTIEKFRPLVLFEAIEIEGDPNSAARKSKQLLEDLRYALFLQRGSVLSPKASTDIQEGHVSDFLAAPIEKLDGLANLLGRELRPLTDDERIGWVREMAGFPMKNHQQHAAAVLERWRREDLPLYEKAKAVLAR